MKRFLVIQTAFIGDVVLATAVLEKLHDFYPDAGIDFLVRDGNEKLLENHPFISKVWIWNKKRNKYGNLKKLITDIRSCRYDYVINLHRFASSGLITILAGAGRTIGFDKNPLSAFFTEKRPHIISNPGDAHPVHELQRNQSLIESLTDIHPAMPRLYPSALHYRNVEMLKRKPYICIAPSSVWFTKQYPVEKWQELILNLPAGNRIYLIGGGGDSVMADEIIEGVSGRDVESLCGKLGFLESAALMQDAVMNYVNDSAPLHFAVSVNANVTALYCSTVPAFGFFPAHEKGRYVETELELSCRPCGLHGKSSCPEGHFDCARTIRVENLL